MWPFQSKQVHVTIYHCYPDKEVINHLTEMEKRIMATLEEFLADEQAISAAIGTVATVIPSLVAGNAAKDATIADLTAKLAAAGVGITPEEQAAIDAADAQAKADLATIQGVLPTS